MKLSDLPVKQQQAVKLVSRGLSDKQIAVIMEIETQTAKNLIYTIRRKIRVKSRAAVTPYFYHLIEKRDST